MAGTPVQRDPANLNRGNLCRRRTRQRRRGTVFRRNLKPGQLTPDKNEKQKIDD
jgi:hypothetical protein